ncbi:MAG: DUF4132 domain-containing protein [Myxococcota bacterium]|nr:DUF4132 domain-containing protein [Myxococcota bacterium]
MAKKKTPAAKPSKKSASKKAKAKPAPRTAVRKHEPGWVDAGKGYELGIRDGKLAARKDGATCSVPKALKDGPVAERLLAAIDFLEDHERTCLGAVETWMLRSLPVPRKVLESVMVDDAWAKVLRDAWVVPVAADNAVDREAGGFFRGVDPQKGIGVVDRAGETAWLETELVMIPHPTLLDEVDDLRGLAVEIGVTQGLSQLFRETFVVPKVAPADPMAIDSYSGGEFGMLSQAIGLTKRLGYRVAGGAAVARVLERGRFVEARYDIGDGDPMWETTTGSLGFVDDKQRPVAVVDVPPVAFSEGMRMASMIYAKRKIEKEGSDD